MIRTLSEETGEYTVELYRSTAAPKAQWQRADRALPRGAEEQACATNVRAAPKDPHRAVGLERSKRVKLTAPREDGDAPRPVL